MEHNLYPDYAYQNLPPTEAITPSTRPHEELGIALHDLCQPLTTMQCRLEMARIVDGEAEYREAVSIALRECDRLNDCVARMRATLRNLFAAAESQVG